MYIDPKNIKQPATIFIRADHHLTWPHHTYAFHPRTYEHWQPATGQGLYPSGAVVIVKDTARAAVKGIEPTTTSGESVITMALLEAHRLTKTYTVDHRAITVLKKIDLSVEAGQFLVISGSSGSGKTTLLTLLSGLDRPTSGSVFIDRQDISSASEEALAPLRNKTIGFVFQSFHLVPSMTALENIMFPAELIGDKRAGERAGHLLERVGMAERQDNLPSQLSGGEKQRIALCRALINRPRLLFADEPTGNLDTENGKMVLKQLIDLKNEHDATLVLVTHNPDIANAADKVITLQDGRLT